MFLTKATTTITTFTTNVIWPVSTTASPPLLHLLSLSKPCFPSPKPTFKFPHTTANKNSPSYSLYSSPKMSWLNKLGFGTRTPNASSMDSSIVQGPDDDMPAPGQQFAQLGAGCFWGVELAFQRVPGVTKTEVGYTQGYLHNPTYEDVCSGTTNHSEVVRVQYDPKECSFGTLLDVFWARHDPTTLNRQVSFSPKFCVYFRYFDGLFCWVLVELNMAI